jgi:hypothetical protein
MYIKTVLFSDDKAVIAGTEDELQYSIYKFNQIAENDNFKISTESEVLAFKGHGQYRNK